MFCFFAAEFLDCVMNFFSCNAIIVWVCRRHGHNTAFSWKKKTDDEFPTDFYYQTVVSIVVKILDMEFWKRFRDGNNQADRLLLQISCFLLLLCLPLFTQNIKETGVFSTSRVSLIMWNDISLFKRGDLLHNNNEYEQPRPVSPFVVCGKIVGSHLLSRVSTPGMMSIHVFRPKQLHVVAAVLHHWNRTHVFFLSAVDYFSRFLKMGVVWGSSHLYQQSLDEGSQLTRGVLLFLNKRPPGSPARLFFISPPSSPRISNNRTYKMAGNHEDRVY